MKSYSEQWHRFNSENVPVYISRKGPAWFVPDTAGDTILQDLMLNPQRPLTIEEQRFLGRLPDNNFSSYTGLFGDCGSYALKELWFHVTNRCNMSCNHCLFSSDSSETPSLSAQFVSEIASQAFGIGCRLFALTGGEPFVHKEIRTIIDNLLSMKDSHVVALTNGVNIGSFLDDIKSWGTERFHLQLSIDGLQQTHDTLRGAGSFSRLGKSLQTLRSHGIPFTLSMAVSKGNVDDMTSVVDYAADAGASGIHYMWHFVRGRGKQHDFVEPEQIFESLVSAYQTGLDRGVSIDNMEALKTQIFCARGTVHDGSSAARESAAVGPDMKLYPSAATVGIDALGTAIDKSLSSVWDNSPILNDIRNSTIAGDTNPWRFFTGGGDFDHSFMHKGKCIATDPYSSLYEKALLYLIENEAGTESTVKSPALRLSIGEVLSSCADEGTIRHIHSNCLLSVSGDSYQSVREFYSQAAIRQNDDILNPVCYPEEEIGHIPRHLRFRGYGCGSPVTDAAIKEGETVIDLGCGRGIECFIASAKTGKTGQVIGIDMLDPMLKIASEGALEVASTLGFNNLHFKKGYLESLPLDNCSADVVLSNCVLNLSPHKRKMFSELYRVLRSGGRVVVSDVVCEKEPGGVIRNDTTLKGECIGASLRQRDLLGLLEESGFENFRVIKRFPYRVVKGHQFYSLTLEAYKRADSPLVDCMYRGPFATAITADGKLLVPGTTAKVRQSTARALGEEVLIFDESGMATNVEMTSSCACAPASGKKTDDKHNITEENKRHRSGCMVCGSDLIYTNISTNATCSYCQKELSANSVCAEGHFVCDQCHSAHALNIIEKACIESRETDMLSLFSLIRSHPSVPVHGPEHHAIVPAVVITAYINSGGKLPREIIATAIQRGIQIAGGSCAFTGICGAATGVGVAFSLILDATPLKGTGRMLVQSAVTEVMKRLCTIEAARCCRRDCIVALQCAAEISEKFISVKLQAENIRSCTQVAKNHECIGSLCSCYGEKIVVTE